MAQPQRNPNLVAFFATASALVDARLQDGSADRKARSVGASDCVIAVNPASTTTAGIGKRLEAKIDVLWRLP